MSRGEIYTRAEIARLVAMMKDGESIRAMAQSLERSEHSIRVKASKIRRTLGLPRGGSREFRLIVRVPGVALHRLFLVAEMRGSNPSALASDLISVIAKDDLFNAVLGEDA
jgi:hypothetical protein